MRMNRLSWVMPALLTRMSTWPSAFSASSPSLTTAARSRRSQGSTNTRRAELGGKRVELLFVGAGDRDVSALSMQRLGDRPADAASGAGDERALACQGRTSKLSFS